MTSINANNYQIDNANIYIFVDLVFSLNLIIYKKFIECINHINFLNLV